jgi:hypothetical protein
MYDIETVDGLMAFADRVLARHGRASYTEQQMAGGILLEDVELRQEGCWMCDEGEA